MKIGKQLGKVGQLIVNQLAVGEFRGYWVFLRFFWKIMDIEKQPLKIFNRETMLRTPQGWVVLASFIVNWALVLLALITNLSFIVPRSGPVLVYLVILPWPFIVLLIFVCLSSPDYRASISVTFFTASVAAIPYWWLYA